MRDVFTATANSAVLRRVLCRAASASRDATTLATQSLLLDLLTVFANHWEEERIAEYLLNSIDAVVITDDEVIFSGDCSEVVRPMQ